eukprot:366005-Chlamydomonas_euryale.AAC.4
MAMFWRDFSHRLLCVWGVACVDRGRAWFGVALCDVVNAGVLCRVVSCRVVAWRGVSWRGVSCRVVSCRGVAWRGVAWRGVGWRGVGWRSELGGFGWVGWECGVMEGFGGEVSRRC